MQIITKQLIAATGTLVLAYLVLAHSTGTARTISAMSAGFVGSVKALQGR